MRLGRVAAPLLLVACAPAAEGTGSSVAADPAPAPDAVLDGEPLDIQDISGDFFVLAIKQTQGGFLRGLVPERTVSLTLDGAPLSFGTDRRFFVAFDRDEGPNVKLVAKTESGAVVPLDLEIAPREWDIERVNVAKGTGGGGEAWWKKREPEWLAIRDARAKETGAQGWRQDFVWPVKGRISGRFGRQRIYRGEPGSYHSGIDIAPGNGVPFVAPADGVVVLARTGFSLEGGIIIVDHGAGLNSAFIHLSRLSVAEGDAVKQGQQLGNVGASGRATGPHLHWSLMWQDKRLDPLLFLPPMP